MNKTEQLIINPAKEAIVETKVIQEAEPETYTITMTKRQLMFLHQISGNLSGYDKESMGYEFYQKVNKIDADFAVLGIYDPNTNEAVSNLRKAHLARLKSLGLDS